MTASLLALSGAGSAMTVAAIAIAILMVTTWIISLVVRNASIVDIVWGLGFVVVAWTVRLSIDGGNEARQWLLVAMATIWGLRLAGYLAWRNLGHGEDYRYRAMRRRWGARFGLVSLVTVFVFQGLMMWTVSLALQLGQVSAEPDLSVLAMIGSILWTIGLAFETIGDAQLAAFKSNPDNAGKVMNKGLWKYTRHPNYFGDACVWWGIALVASETVVGRWGLLGALLMNILLRRVSGVTLLEKSLVKRREGYAEYVQRTSPFIPRRPRRW